MIKLLHVRVHTRILVKRGCPTAHPSFLQGTTTRGHSFLVPDDHLLSHVDTDREVDQINEEELPDIGGINCESYDVYVLPDPQRQYVQEVVNVEGLPNYGQSSKLISNLEDQNEGGVPDDEEPDFGQPLNPRILRPFIAYPNVGDDEDAKNYLEPPVYNSFLSQDDQHEENSEGYEDQELFLQVLNDLPEMEHSWISSLESLPRIALIQLNHLLILEDLMQLILQEHYYYEEPLLKLWRVLEVLYIALVIKEILLCLESSAYSVLRPRTLAIFTKRES
jgi:hypothetical protein